ncbi:MULTISPECIES: M23 family metallopeptidase [Dehalobacter]|uniref:M23 family metallopeptidase n=1 Tax=Dehalobacter TaxID=56112 RepID=UPI002587235C|nr:M23 family metallopeptidase [Dehalobacter sp.]MDJ0305404.1 M23 family metallopeptidase [Dehalobacter sp.]
MLPLKNPQITKAYGTPPPAGFTYAKGYHSGIDMVSSDPTILASVPGIIIAKGFDPPGWGNYIILRYQNEYDLIHAHMSSFNVARGQTVKEGDRLGIMGATGQVTGAHLHFEVRKGPWELRNDIDPAAWLGIKNAVGTAVRIKEEKELIKNLILCNPGPDERAAGYLADHLAAPVDHLNTVATDTLAAAQNVYVVGSSEKPAANCVNIVGSDRYDTCAQVIKICQGR